MLGDIGLPELLVIFIIILVLFGPGKPPDVGKAIGEALRGFKKALQEPDKTLAERSYDKDENMRSLFKGPKIISAQRRRNAHDLLATHFSTKQSEPWGLRRRSATGSKLGLASGNLVSKSPALSP